METVDLVVSAFQTASDVVLQKSIREGFGLTVTEAMWKNQPVIGGNVGGIRAQISDGESGFLVDTVEECASRIVQLSGKTGASRVHGHRCQGQALGTTFLLPRLLRDYLRAAKAAKAPDRGIH